MQVSAGHRTLSDQILHFVRSKLCMTGHVTDRFRLMVKSLSKKKGLFNTFIISETKKESNIDSTSPNSPKSKVTVYVPGGAK